MNPNDWNIIESHYGEAIKDFLLDENAVSHRSKSGAFVIPNKIDMTMCQSIQTNSFRSLQPALQNKKVTQKDKKKPNYALPPAEELGDASLNHNFKLYKDFRRLFNLRDPNNLKKKSSEEENHVKNNKIYQNKIHKRIGRITKHTSVERSCKIFSQMMVDPLKTLEGGSKILFSIIENDISPEDKENLSSLLPILEEFSEKHSKFKYTVVWNSLSKKNEEKLQFQDQVSVRSICEFFSIIYRRVVPKKLFQTTANRKRVIKILKNYLETPITTDFPDSSYESLDYTGITWLDAIENNDTKKKIFTAVVVWFFDFFLLAKFDFMFKSAKATDSTQPIYIPSKKWKIRVASFIEDLQKNGVIENVDSNNLSENNPPEAVLELHPKRNGIRPLYKPFYPDKEKKNEKYFLQKFLHQLFLANFDTIKSQNIYDIWKQVVRDQKNSQDTSFFFITCDIKDAFPSINQDKLVEIIENLVCPLPDDLPLRSFTVFRRRRDPARVFFKREYFIADGLLALPLPAEHLVHPDGITLKIAKKNFILKRILSYIKEQIVNCKRGQFWLRKGVGQGIGLSSNLSEIYYATMVREKLGKFNETGTLIRYVDDILYITKDKESAQQFLAIVEEGIPSYNCYFSSSKTHTNLDPHCDSQFIYLGYKFDIKNFEVVPEFFDIPIQYVMSSDRAPPKKEFRIFQSRLMNMPLLKVDPIVLDLEINSWECVEKTITKIANIAAKKCFVLLLNLFETKKLGSRRILNLIEQSVIVLMKLITRNFPTENNHSDNVQRMIWKAHVQVFRKNIQLNRVFGPILKYNSLKSHY